jgi:hypothetical protein
MRALDQERPGTGAGRYINTSATAKGYITEGHDLTGISVNSGILFKAAAGEGNYDVGMTRWVRKLGNISRAIAMVAKLNRLTSTRKRFIISVINPLATSRSCCRPNRMA